MSDLPTRSDLFAVFRRSLRTATVSKLNPAVVDIDGSDLNLVASATALMGEEATSSFADCMANAFAATAAGAALDRVIFDRAGGLLPRLAATPATVNLTLTRPVPGLATPGTFPAGGQILLGGVTFATDLDAVFGGFTATVLVSATAVIAGPDGNVQASPPAGSFVNAPFDTTIVIANQAAAGGTDQESDTAYRGRYFSFFPTIRRGTLAAIQSAGPDVPGVAVATAIEIVNPYGIPAAAVQLIVADANGNSSAAMLQAVTDLLLDFRACGIPVTVIGGLLNNTTPVIWNIQVESGFDSVAVAAQVRAVTAAITEFLAPGAVLYRSSLIAAARTVPGAIVTDTSLVSPALDVVPTDPSTGLPSPRVLLRVLSQNVSFVTS